MIMKKQSFVVCGVLIWVLLLISACGEADHSGPGGGYTESNGGYTGSGSGSTASSSGNTGSSGGYTGPSTNPTAVLVTVAEAKNLYDDTRVTVRGKIVRALGGEDYVLQDSTGEITIEIDRKKWNGLFVGADDLVEIYGEIDRDRFETEIDVKTIRLL